LKFWNELRLQEFWSGKSFLRTDDGSLLSYDLGLKMVEHLSENWEQFASFVLNADAMDSGASAARSHLGTDLGDYACALLEKEPSPRWSPNPQAWEAEPESGRFVGL
jgi:hypothetical protein